MDYFENFNMTVVLKCTKAKSATPSANLSALDLCNSPVWNIDIDELDF